MPGTHYQYGTHLDVPDLVPQLTRLSNAAFASYQGTMQVDETFMAWYLRRPGCRPDLCTAALHEGRLVSNVLVAIQELQLGGEVLPCGIVDTVATDPEHQQRGLARRLMDEAHRRMREAGTEAAVLYTNPDDHPYRFYGRLGYGTRALGEALLGDRSEPPGPLDPQPALPTEAPAIRALLDRHYAAYDGYSRWTEDAWRWHRVQRPPEMPCTVLVVRDREGVVVATAAFAEADLTVAGEVIKASVLSDFACIAGDSAFLAAFLAAAPRPHIMAFVDVAAPLHRMLTARGFTGAVREVAMVLPFSECAHAAIARRSSFWYCMVESLVGV